MWYRQPKPDNKSKDNDSKDYFFYELLRMVEKKSKENLHHLDNDLKLLIDKNKHGWHKLVNWDMNNHSQTSIGQDNIVNGVTSPHKETYLIHNTSSSFNSHKFCDFNDYLPKLVLLAHMVDEPFQESVRHIFNINKPNNIGYVAAQENNTMTATTFSIETMSEMMNEIDNDRKAHGTNNNSDSSNNSNNSENAIEYTPGPVKLYSRALNKSENDYRNELYPTSACVLDFNRCTLTFNSISTLLNALKLFINKVKYYQSGNIIKIVRCKNTFKNYVDDGPQCADIKLNVIIKGDTNNIVGEVQFLLKPMLNFKKKAHNLYSIQRQEMFNIRYR